MQPTARAVGSELLLLSAPRAGAGLLQGRSALEQLTAGAQTRGLSSAVGKRGRSPPECQQQQQRKAPGGSSGRTEAQEEARRPVSADVELRESLGDPAAAAAGGSAGQLQRGASASARPLLGAIPLSGGLVWERNGSRRGPPASLQQRAHLHSSDPSGAAAAAPAPEPQRAHHQADPRLGSELGAPPHSHGSHAPEGPVAWGSAPASACLPAGGEGAGSSGAVAASWQHIQQQLQRSSGVSRADAEGVGTGAWGSSTAAPAAAGVRAEVQLEQRPEQQQEQLEQQQQQQQSLESLMKQLGSGSAAALRSSWQVERPHLPQGSVAAHDTTQHAGGFAMAPVRRRPAPTASDAAAQGSVSAGDSDTALHDLSSFFKQQRQLVSRRAADTSGEQRQAQLAEQEAALQERLRLYRREQQQQQEAIKQQQLLQQQQQQQQQRRQRQQHQQRHQQQGERAGLAGYAWGMRRQAAAPAAAAASAAAPAPAAKKATPAVSQSAGAASPRQQEVAPLPPKQPATGERQQQRQRKQQESPQAAARRINLLQELQQQHPAAAPGSTAPLGAASAAGALAAEASLTQLLQQLQPPQPPQLQGPASGAAPAAGPALAGHQGAGVLSEVALQTCPDLGDVLRAEDAGPGAGDALARHRQSLQELLDKYHQQQQQQRQQQQQQQEGGVSAAGPPDAQLVRDLRAVLSMLQPGGGPAAPPVELLPAEPPPPPPPPPTTTAEAAPAAEDGAAERQQVQAQDRLSLQGLMQQLDEQAVAPRRSQDAEEQLEPPVVASMRSMLQALRPDDSTQALTPAAEQQATAAAARAPPAARAPVDLAAMIQQAAASAAALTRAPPPAGVGPQPSLKELMSRAGALPSSSSLHAPQRASAADSAAAAAAAAAADEVKRRLALNLARLAEEQQQRRRPAPAGLEARPAGAQQAAGLGALLQDLHAGSGGAAAAAAEAAAAAAASAASPLPAASGGLSAVLSGQYWQEEQRRKEQERQLEQQRRLERMRLERRREEQERLERERAEQERQALELQRLEGERLERERAANSLAAATQARINKLMAEVDGGEDVAGTAAGRKQRQGQRGEVAEGADEMGGGTAAAARRRKAKEREKAAGLAAAAAAKAERKAAKKSAAAAASSAVGSRWANKLQQLQQQQEGEQPLEEAGAALPELSELSDDDVGAEAASPAAPGPPAGQQMQEVQMPPGCSVRQLAALLGAEVSRLEELLREQLGEEVRSAEDPVSPESAELAALEFGRVLLRPPEDAAADAAAVPRPPVVTVMGHVDHGKTSLLDALRSGNTAAGEAGGITQHIGAFEVSLPGSGSTITFLDTPGHAAFGAMRARGAAATDIVVLAVAADDGVMPQTREALAHARAAQVPVVVALTKCDLPQARPDQVKLQLVAEGLELEEFGGDVQCVATAAKGGQGLDALEEALLLQAEVMELKAPVDVPATGVVVEAQVSKGLGPVATVILRTGRLKLGDSIVVGTECGRVRAMRDGRGAALAQAGPGQAVLVSGLRGVPAAGDELLAVASEARATKVAAARAARAEDFRLAQLARVQAEGARRQQQLREREYERRRVLRQRIREIQLSGFKRHTGADLRSAVSESLQLEEAKLKGGGSGEAAAAAAGGPAAGAAGGAGGAAAAGAAEAGVEAGAAAAAEALAPGAPQLTLLIKADVQGSAEAVRDAVAAAAEGKVHLRVVYCGVGPVSSSDAHLAAATGAAVVAFNLRAPAPDVDAALRGARVELLQHRVIYHLLDDVAARVDEALAGGGRGGAGGAGAEQVLGAASVLQVFPLVRNRREEGRVAGCRVTEGSLRAGPGVVFRVLRGGEVVYEGPCTSLRVHKEDVESVGRAAECGVVLDGGRFGGYQPGDVLQCVQQRAGPQ